MLRQFEWGKHMTLYTSAETVRTVRTATSTFIQLLSPMFVQCCFTSTETVGVIRDGEPRTATSAFSQPLNSRFPFKVRCPYDEPDDRLTDQATGLSQRALTSICVVYLVYSYCSLTHSISLTDSEPRDHHTNQHTRR